MTKNFETLNPAKHGAGACPAAGGIQRPTFNFERKDLESSDAQRLTLNVESFLLWQFGLPLFTLLILPLLLAGCGSPRIAYRPDAEIERNAAAAKNAYSAGSMARASVFYQKALDHARLTDQPAEIARLAYNLAACRAQTQKYDEALELLDEAQFESAKTGADLPEAVLLRAEILRHIGRTNEALATAKSGLDALGKKSNSINPQLQVFLAELANDQNDGKLALQELDKLNPDLLKSSDPVVQAKAVQTRGRALLIEKRPDEAAGCFDEAAMLYQKSRRYSDMALSLQNAGAAYTAMNKRPEAFDRHFRAARSMFFSGDKVKARVSLNKANELAKESGDQQMLSALARLENEIASGCRK